MTATKDSIDTIFEILKEFNFEKVEKVMIATDWKWARPDGLRTPTIDEMKDLCISLLINAEKETTTISSGGFEARCKIKENDEKELCLSFVTTVISKRI